MVKRRIAGGKDIVCAVEGAGISAVRSPARGVTFCALEPRSVPGDGVSFLRGKIEFSSGGMKLAELSATGCGDLNAVILRAVCAAPEITYGIIPSAGAKTYAPVCGSSRGEPFSVLLIESRGCFLAVSLYGAVRCGGDELTFTGGTGYAVFCVGDDPNELLKRSSAAVSVSDQPGFERFSAERTESSSSDALLDALDSLRTPDGLVFSETGGSPADPFAQYLAVRAYAARKRYGDALEILRRCIALSSGDGQGSGVFASPLARSLFALAALDLPLKQLGEYDLRAAADLVRGAADSLRYGMAPFGGWEKDPVARTFPEYGSAFATAAFAAAADKLAKRRRKDIPDDLIKTAENARSRFAYNFIPDGSPAAYSAGRAANLKRPAFRRGFCAACGEAGSWTARDQGVYLCLDCYTKGGYVPNTPRKIKKDLKPVLYSRFIGSDIYPAPLVSDMFVSLLKEEQKLTDTLDCLMLRCAVKADPYYRRYSAVASRLASERLAGTSPLNDPAVCAVLLLLDDGEIDEIV